MARGRPGRSGRSRGEVNEVVGQLEQLSALDGRKPDVVKAKRECFQKLIRYMTAGIDMSACFIPATKCVALSKFDLPLKKMLYLYLRSAARQNAAVALLVVQTLLTDAKDADPTIRGLAVRSICSLRVADLMENVYAALDVGLKDPHPYVREVSVIGILKCHNQDPTGTKVRGYLDAVRSFLTTDTDPQVVANCLYVLQQLGALCPAIVNRPLVVSLLNHFRLFSDWAQCLVLEVLLAHYRPASEQERFDVLEILDSGLNHTNSAVVMATAKLFLQYTANYPDQYAQVLTSIRGPLQTLLLGREPEIVYAALSNLVVLAQRHPSAFADLAPDFFCRPEDPSYLKLLKLEALVAVADTSNAFDAAEEAAQYARDPEDEVARAAVRAVSHIALKVAEVEGILDRLLLFLNHSRPAVAQEAVAVMADMLRRFPDAAGACVPAIAEVDPETLTLPASRAALVWVLGEFGETVQDAPYTLEALVQGFGEETSEVKLALLTGVTKLFFKRAPECKVALGQVLAAGAADEDAAVRDRALFYHRLLAEAGPEQAKLVIAAPRPPMARFEESLSAEVQDRIFDELNTLSTIYRAPAATFIDAGDIGERHETDSIGGGGEVHGSEEGASSEALDGGTALVLDLGDSTEGTSVGGVTEGLEGALVMPTTVTGGGPSTASSGTELDLLAMGLGGGNSAGVGTSAAVDSFGASVSAGGGILGDLGAGLSPAPPAAAAPQQQHDLGDMLGDFFGGGGNGGITTSLTSAGIPQQQQQQQELLAPALAVPQSEVSPGSAELADDLDAFFGGLGGVTSSQHTPASITAPVSAPQHAQHQEDIQLLPKPSISAAEFQSAWATWDNPGNTTTGRQELGGASALSAISARGFREFSDHVGQANIATFAAPKEGSTPPLRFLLHAQRKGGSGARVLAQVTVNSSPASPVADIIVKSSDGAAASYVQELLQTLLLTI